MIRVVGWDWNYLHGRYGGVQNGKEEPGGRYGGIWICFLLLHIRLGLRPVGRRYRKAECVSHKELV